MIFNLVYIILSFAGTTYLKDTRYIAQKSEVIEPLRKYRYMFQYPPPSPPPIEYHPSWLPPRPSNTEDYDGDGA